MPKDLSTLLDAEHDAIMLGRLDELESFAQQKLALLENPAALRGDLRAKTARNQLLLEAAARGLRAACNTLKALENAGNLSTYARDGTLCHETKAMRKLEHKA